ncbi:MAG: 50S ribosomal protein L25 [Spirochaetaceae bacterium]|jgi:large subunit ribosomal protein L25|nr:50S ribosomal protein L25 [Spirochaetaceae bacterium]
MSQLVFAARNRIKTGSGEARRIRHSGRIPAIIYGRTGTALPIDLDALEFTNGVKGISESTIVKIDIDGSIHEAFVKDTQRRIMDGAVLHVDFYEVESNTSLRAKVSVHIHGNPIGVREGGILEIPLHDVEVECLPKDLPERIDVDVSDLRVNQSIHVRDLPPGEGLRYITGGDQVVALVKFAKAEAAASSEEEAAAQAAEAKS